MSSTYANPFTSTIEIPTETVNPAPAVAPNPLAPPVGPAPFGDPTDEVFEFDLTNASSSMGVPIGTYLFRLVDIEKTTSNNSGNPMWVFSFSVIQQADGSPSPHAGKISKKFCALTEAALGILAATLEALALPGGGTKTRWKKSEAINRMCYGEVTEGDYQGRKTSNLGNLYPYATNPGAKWNAGGIQIPQ